MLLSLTAPTGQEAAVESRPSSGWQEPEGCCLACVCKQLLVASLSVYNVSALTRPLLKGSLSCAADTQLCDYALLMGRAWILLHAMWWRRVRSLHDHITCIVACACLQCIHLCLCTCAQAQQLLEFT
jgi:hypothetical protein